VCCLVVFFVARVAYWLTGGGFSTAMLNASYQLLDIRALRAHPIQSAVLLHIQPPLFNLFVGSVLRWSFLPRALSFQLIYLGCGITIVCALYLLLVGLGFRRAAAIAGVSVVAVSPLVMSYENTVTYEYPTAMLIVLSALAALRLAQHKQLRILVGLTILLTIVVLTRALFHPIWLIAVLVTTVAISLPRRLWLKASLVLLIPALFVGGTFAKNQVLFGDATLSSWFGMNLGRGVLSPMPRSDLMDLIRQHRVTQSALVPPLSPYAAYRPAYGTCHSSFSEPVLTDESTTSGRTNFNAQCFLPVYADAQQNALTAALAYPGTYLRDRVGPFAQHFSLPPLNGQAPGINHFGENPVLHGLAAAYSSALLQVPLTVHLPGATFPLLGATVYPVSISIVLLIATLLIIGRGIVSAIAVILRRARTPANVTWIFLGLTVAYLTVISIATEYGENQRFRAMIDPLLLAIVVTELVAVGIRGVSSRRRTLAARRMTEDAPTRAA
jgi:hypothetical protein